LPSPRLRAALRHFARTDRGAAAVEFALIAPILLTLVFGIVDFGRAMYVYNVLTAGMREGARAAAVAGIAGGVTADSVSKYGKGRVAGYIKGALGLTVADSTTIAGNTTASYSSTTGLITVSLSGYTYTR
jgi:Flp pilus assembly protein TadG